MADFRQAFVAPDGTVFDTKAEVQDYMRKPKILEALRIITGGNNELAEWLLENEETVESAFEIGTIKRVSKADAKALNLALDTVAEINDPKLKFLQENAEAVRDSFRWPKTKRMDDEEKVAASRQALVDASDGNEDLADWVVAHKDHVLEAYNAGKPKRKVSEKALEALEAYRQQKKAEAAAKS